MLMKVSKDEFVNQFRAYNREENFSIAARKTLFEYIEEMEEDTGNQTVIDFISLCVTWKEYDYDEIIQAYGHLIDQKDYQENERDYMIEDLIKELQERTIVIPVSGIIKSFLVENF